MNGKDILSGKGILNGKGILGEKFIMIFFRKPDNPSDGEKSQPGFLSSGKPLICETCQKDF